MYVVIVEFTTHPEHSAEFLARVRRQASDSLSLEADCHVFDVCVDPARDNFALLYEIYTDSSAFGAHLAAQHFIDFDAEVRDWVSAKKISTLERL